MKMKKNFATSYGMALSYSVNQHFVAKELCSLCDPFATEVLDP